MGGPITGDQGNDPDRPSPKDPMALRFMPKNPHEWFKGKLKESSGGFDEWQNFLKKPRYLNHRIEVKSRMQDAIFSLRIVGDVLFISLSKSDYF